MRRASAIAVTAVCLAVIGAAAYGVLTRSDGTAGTAPALSGAPASAALLARGEYLTHAADCAACHTVPGSHRPFAGGVAFKLPFGTIYSSNITPDTTTGIGAWSDEEFVRAVREGVRKDGQHLYPAFPYTSYTALGRDDVLAIKAYLASLPAIKQADRANDLGFPFNQRWAMGVWNAAFFKSRRFTADPGQSPAWNSGAYLANALGHCGECHTPRNLGYGLERGDEFAGAELQGWRAYNITADATHGIGAWSPAELAQFLTTGHAEGRGAASGPMAEAVANSLQYLTAEDAASLVEYLRAVAPRAGSHPIDVDPRPAPALASTATAPPAAAKPSRGLKLFEGACASCHQWDGKGQQTHYAALLGTRSVNDPAGANVTQVILQGVDQRIGDADVFMPAFGAYTNADVADLANYVIAQFGGKAGLVTAAEVARRREL